MKKTDILLYKYFQNWINVYKRGSIRKVSFKKYELTLDWIIKLAPDLKICDLDRVSYQQIINEYAECHERQTTMDFHHHLKGCLLDAFDEGLLTKDPTRKVVIKGKAARPKKIKFLSNFELQLLLKELNLQDKLNFDWLIFLIAKTGLRFSEAVALTPDDFDFTKQLLNISKTWNYKELGGFLPTKNKSSVRKIQLDWQTISRFASLVQGLEKNKPIFVFKEKVFNSTINDILARRCKKAKIPAVISIHGLRHTHASILLYAGVSIASVAKRLGHSSMNTTERIYLHIINELENKDIDLVMRSISALN
ncbi:Tyrosine recombinase XerC [Mycoplasmopsis agalactiae]|uniref:Phage family integrase n=1 Tax=Mycoplasmopsis agalactiae (strain NCTC 10123 / CIP 59.7 / PG2) TaxID=347257 RepID=A5IZ10_MYCAP|nr:site-specific integrase [Mycoplasmopsis agalactiae]MCE6057305.1 site-specific integrase [Mycoplasmopsis agalactiae]MCE6079090.1 site-specific integrase [Mycoplasmopsis agalactiae]MCE6095476.1 site-specific integrase [Mycoplasmopsis agalactiae]MCE6114731.1 site-specific integrase [Mycoplasmopsis agalactiae]NLS34468.1 site-specific integrase [Mycoplasmopsis agalactiae]